MTVEEDAPSVNENNGIEEGQLPSQKPVRRNKLLMVEDEAVDSMQVVLESIDCMKVPSSDSTSRIATRDPTSSMEKILETSAEFIGGVFSSKERPLAPVRTNPVVLGTVRRRS